MTANALTVMHIINRVASQGGAEVSLVEMLPLLQQDGIRNIVVPLYRYDDGGARARLLAEGILVEKSLDLPALRTIAALTRLIKAHEPDLVHTTLFEADLYGRTASLIAGVPVVTSLVNMQYELEARPPGVPAWKLQTVRLLDGVLTRHVNVAVHAITQAVAASAVRHLGVQRGLIRVIPRGRDQLRLGRRSAARREDVLQSLGLPVDSEVVLNVGRHETQKGQLHLVRAFALVAAARPRARLLIAGRAGGVTSPLIAEIDRLGLSGRVELLGARADVPDLLRACDVFAFTSLWEGLGGAVLEAMALEAPVVAFDIAPVREVLGATGLLLEVGDERALASAVIGMLRDPAAARTLGAAARARFLQHYELRHVTRAMADFYRDAASSARETVDMRLAYCLTAALRRVVAVGKSFWPLRRPDPQHPEEQRSELATTDDPYAAEEVLAEYVAFDELMPVEELLFRQVVTPGQRVLDLGVGSGRTTPFLARGAASYVGVDVSSAMVSACQTKHPGIDFRVGDAAALDGYADAAYDVVVFSYNGIDHLLGRARSACLRECARVLRPGGRLIFSGHNPRAVVVLPRAERGPDASRVRLLASSALRTYRRTRRLVATRAFWTGTGVVHEPVHGGFSLHMATPRRWAAEAFRAGFSLERTVPCGQTGATGWYEADWYYYVFRKGSADVGQRAEVPVRLTGTEQGSQGARWG